MSDFSRELEKKMEPWIKSKEEAFELLPTDILEWIPKVRPLVEGKQRMILPFWRDIYNDHHNNKMIVAGRQVFKSTYCTDILACEATSAINSQILYCTYDDINLSGFSRQRLQNDTFGNSEVLRRFPRYRIGNVGEISLKNGSTIYMTTDHGQYHHVEGKSAQHIMLDEAQYQDIQYFDKIMLTMTMTQGRISVLGLGGEAGSPYHDMWERTNKSEWVFDDPYWREKLRFGYVTDVHTKAKKWGLIEEEYLMDVLKGRWKAENPGATHWHGYHLPQTMFPQIPLTIQDAIEVYDIDEIYSIEYKRKHMSAPLFSSHVMGEFFEAVRRPITRKMIEDCQTPYHYVNMLEAWQIADLKHTYGDRIKIAMGVDFGSGQTSLTVVAILIFWKVSDPVKKQTGGGTRVQLAFLEQRPPEYQIDQAEYLTELFKEARCDIGVGDLGYGQIQVKIIQEGGANRKTGTLFDGVNSSNFYGCRTVSDETKPMLEYLKKIDEHGEVRESIKIDKTTAIDEFISFLGEMIPHPIHPFDETYTKTRFLIPGSKQAQAQIDFIYKDWTSLTRKDLDIEIDKDEPDPKQKKRREYNHPSDSLMACIYALKADRIKSEWNWVSIGNTGPVDTPSESQKRMDASLEKDPYE